MFHPMGPMAPPMPPPMSVRPPGQIHYPSQDPQRMGAHSAHGSRHGDWVKLLDVALFFGKPGWDTQKDAVNQRVVGEMRYIEMASFSRITSDLLCYQ